MEVRICLLRFRWFSVGIDDSMSRDGSKVVNGAADVPRSPINATSVGNAGLLINVAVSYQRSQFLKAHLDEDKSVLHPWADSVILQDSLATAD
jgi:hypothetical protein